MNGHKRQMSALVVASGVSLFFAGFVSSAQAELREIGDSELSAITGQAVIAFDVTEAVDTTQTRFTFGSTVETQTNFDQVTLGEYDNPSASTAADIDIANMSLGHIENGNIVPFEAENPYFEIAEKNGELVGFRVGFDNARGTLSGDFNSFSGNLGIQIVDGDGTTHDTFLLDDNNNQTNTRATQVGAVIVPDPVEQPTDLEEQAPGTVVASDPVFGDDPQMPADLAPPPVPNLPPQLIVNQLTEFKTIDIGVDDGSGVKEFAKDFFFSFQSEEVEWQRPDGSSSVTAGAGVHFNIPNTMVLTQQQFNTGIPRARTEFIDRNNGMF